MTIPTTRTTAQPTVEVRLTPGHASRALRQDVLAGLRADPKWLPPKWFYDARGSELFEEITRLPEYYPTRAEREILDTRAAELAERTRARCLVELGSGSSEKTRLLLDALDDVGTPSLWRTSTTSRSGMRPVSGSRCACAPATRCGWRSPAWTSS